jgi:branched-chain amino acid transport system substrate-binding protein
LILVSVLSIALPIQAQEDGQPLIGEWESCPTPESLSGEIPLGFNLGLTGATSLYSIPQQQGMNLALAEINASGYLGDASLVGIFEDSSDTLDGAIAVMEKLINEDNVVGVIGPTFSTQAFAADPVAQEAGVPVMGITNLAIGITDMGDYVFRDGLLDSVQIPAAVNQSIDLLGIETAAIIYGDDNEFTITGYEIFSGTLEEREVEIVSTESFQTGDVDFSSQVTNTLANEPDAIMVSALAAEAIPLVEQLREQGFEGPIIGNNGLNAPALLTDMGDDANGIIIGGAWHVSNEAELNQAFVQAFEAEYEFLPDQNATQAYTAVWLFATAIRCSDSTDHAAVRDALAEIQDFASPLGSFSFDENRDPVHEPTVQIIVDGKFEVLTEETAAQVFGE